jgi:hypothetical protein
MDAPSKKRMRSCHDGKKRYTTLEAAKTAAAILVRRKAKAGSPIVSRVNAYPCSCGGVSHWKVSRRYQLGPCEQGIQTGEAFRTGSRTQESRGHGCQAPSGFAVPAGRPLSCNPVRIVPSTRMP